MHRTIIALSYINNLSLFDSNNAAMRQEGGDSLATQQQCWDTGGGRGGSSYC